MPILLRLARRVHSPRGRHAASDQTYRLLLDRIPANQRPVASPTPTIRPPRYRHWAAAASLLLIVTLGIAGICYHRYAEPSDVPVPSVVTPPAAVGAEVLSLQYDQAPLSVIVAELSRIYQVSILVTDPSLADYRITATFCTDESLVDVLLILAEAGNFDVQQDELDAGGIRYRIVSVQRPPR